jgi:hypothetical protein
MAEQQDVQQSEFETLMGKKIGHLLELYKMTDELDESNSDDLQKKLTVYGNIYEIIGDLEAFAVGKSKLNYAYRKEVNATAYLNKTKSKDGLRTLTSKERESVAELATRQYRKLEAEYEHESRKWQNRRDSVLEQINIMKRKQDGIGNTWDKANYINGLA